MTRAKKLVILIGTQKALQIALKNDKPHRRLSSLAARLKEAG
jgi:ATP-dependent exoDNAse (exonuclease V) alpha subunit